MSTHARSVQTAITRHRLASSSSVERAVRAAQHRGCTLVEALVLENLVNEANLTQAISFEARLPQSQPNQLAAATRQALSLVPADICAEHRVVPLAVDRDQYLVVAAADPMDDQAMAEVEFFANRPIIREVASPTGIAWALDSFYGVQTPLLRKQEARAAAVAPVVADQPYASYEVIAGVATTPSIAAAPARSAPALHALADMRRAADLEGVGQAFLRYLGSICERAALFVVREGELRGWRGIGNVSPEAIAVARAPLAPAWSLRKLFAEPHAERTSVVDGTTRQLALRTLGGASNLVLVPVSVDGQVTLFGFGRGLKHTIKKSEVDTVRLATGSELERVRASRAPRPVAAARPAVRPQRPAQPSTRFRPVTAV